MVRGRILSDEELDALLTEEHAALPRDDKGTIWEPLPARPSPARTAAEVLIACLIGVLVAAAAVAALAWALGSGTH